MKTPLSDLTRDQLLEVLDYDPETGTFTWRPSVRYGLAGKVAGAVDRNGYRRVKIRGQHYAEHRLAWLAHTGAWPAAWIDHVDGNKTNNAIKNLRDVPPHQNSQNQRRSHRDAALESIGVSPYHSKFRASIRVNGKVKHLGTFMSEDEAGAAYLAAKRELHAGCTI